MHKVTLAQKHDLPEMASFVRLKYKLASKWPEDLLRGWLGWYVSNRIAVISREIIESGSRQIIGHIQSLLLGRPIENVDYVFHDTYYIDWTGSTFFIDLVIMDDNRLGAFMKEVMVKSVGMKDYLAFTRDHGKMRRVRKYPIEKILRYYEPYIRG